MSTDAKRKHRRLKPGDIIKITNGGETTVTIGMRNGRWEAVVLPSPDVAVTFSRVDDAPPLGIHLEQQP